jgi:hypothetical protein
MDKKARITELFEESIRLERLVATLYLTYARLFSEHSEFWSKLSQEEENHAALIRSGLEQLYKFDLFPLNALAADINSIKENCRRIQEKIDLFKVSAPDLKSAYEFAISIENGAGESHFQVAIDSSENLALFHFLEAWPVMTKTTLIE